MKKNYIQLKSRGFFLSFLVIMTLIACSPEDKIDDPKPEPEPEETTDLPEVDDVVKSFMRQYDVVGASVAFAKDGELVYAKGYGFADETTGEKVTPSSLFRISSISKSVTSIAIMSLIDKGQLTMDDKVFGAEGILGTIYGTQPYGEYLTEIQIKHLLQHTAGGWSNQSNDPTMADQSMTKSELMSWVLDERPLDFKPGTRYSYSNVGYLILGLVIEELSEVSYEEYVRTNILEPIGIQNMRIGGNTAEDRVENEVRNHGYGNQNPYGYNFERRDANGGWIASPSDLARLIVHVDGFNTVPDILEPETIALMTNPSIANENYASGWTVDASNTWSHGGSFPGSRSFAIRTQNGYVGVLFVNSSSNQSGFASAIQNLLKWGINDTSIKWPAQDLFK